MSTPFSIAVKPDAEEFLRTLRRGGTPRRIHHIEYFHDPDVHNAITQHFEIGKNMDPNDPYYVYKHNIEWMRFMGFDYVTAAIGGPGGLAVKTVTAPDTSTEVIREQRSWVDEHQGVIGGWEDFEKYPWPDPGQHDTREMEWYHENLPDDMTILGIGAIGNWSEWLMWLFGYEPLCFALCEQPDLVLAVLGKIEEIFTAKTKAYLQFPRVSGIWGADDLGFKTGLLLGPQVTRELILPGHKKIVQIAHDAGRLYLLHSCGNLSTIMEDLIEDVKIDGKHSFEDTIEDVRDDKRAYGDRLTLLGGIDMDFLCRADEQAIRKRVRETADVCMPGGGWLLGSGNSVANYIPLSNYLAMLDEGRRYCA